jgi:hypothetical protein
VIRASGRQNGGPAESVVAPNTPTQASAAGGEDTGVATRQERTPERTEPISSNGPLHPVLERTIIDTGFNDDLVERLQKPLAHELQTDLPATPVTQNTRLTGCFYVKSPSVRSGGKCLIFKGLTYKAVADSVNDEASRWGPTAFLVLSWRQFLFCGSEPHR